MRSRLRNLFLLGPGLLWLAVFLLIPCGIVFTYSFMRRGVYGGVEAAFSLENFARAADPLYRGIFVDSALIAGAASGIAILLGFPAAYAIARAAQRHRARLLVLVMLPFWSNYLIRTYAWIVLLNREGLINRGLTSLGVVDEPLPLLYNAFAIIVGLVYNYLPFVVLTIYSSLTRLNPEVLEASRDLGGSAARTFLRVVLPLTLPGVAAGGVFVFVLSIGNFITPDLLGGGRLQMVGNLIYSQFLSARDWPFGAALSLMLIGVMMALLFGQALLVRRAQNDAGPAHA